MQKVKIRPADFPLTTSKIKIDIPVVLSLAGIVTVAAVIGAAAFHGGLLNQFSPSMTNSPKSSGVMNTQLRPDLSIELSRLNQKLAAVSAQLKSISQAQTSTSKRVDEIEDTFTSITAAIPASTALSSSPYHRLLETGWDADEMVTRKQKRNRIALLKTEAIMSSKTQIQRRNTLAQTRYAVELSSYENIITARNSWQKLVDSHGSLLNKLEPHLLPTLDTMNKKGRVKLIAGPITTATMAAQICSVLRSNGQTCQERLFSASNITVVSAPEKNKINSTQ